MWLRQNLPIEVKFCRRNAGDGVPYGDLCRDTPPGVSGTTRPNVGDTRGRVSIQGDSSKRVGATLAVVPVPTINGGWRPQADLLELCFVPLALSFKPGISPGGLNPAGEKGMPTGPHSFHLMMHHGIAHKRSLLFMVGM